MSGVSAGSDVQLVSRVRDGDRGAFDLLVERYYGVVFAVSLARLRDPEAAEDLAQEVFLRLYLQIGTLRDGAQFGPWALRAARNLTIDWQRRGQRASRVLPRISIETPGLPDPVDPAKGVVDAMQREDEKRLLWRQLDQLPPEQREMVLLHFMEGLTKRDVAQRLGVHPSTAGRVIDQALGAMRTGLEATLREGLRSPAPQRRRSLARTSAVVAAVAVLPAAARAEIVGVAIAEKAAASTGFLTQLSAKLAAGAAIMGLGKTAATITVAVAVLGAAGVYVSRPGRVNPPTSSISAAIAPSVTDPLPSGWTLEVRNSTGSSHMTQFNQGSFVAEGMHLERALDVVGGMTPARIQSSVDLQKPEKDFKLIAPPGTSDADFHHVLQAEVQKAWNVRFRWEKQMRDVLVLKAPNGKSAALAPANPGGPSRSGNNGADHFVENLGLTPLVDSIETKEGIPVVDESGIQGSFNYRWTGDAKAAATGQFGLQVVPDRREIDILIIEPTSAGGGGG